MDDHMNARDDRAGIPCDLFGKHRKKRSICRAIERVLEYTTIGVKNNKL